MIMKKIFLLLALASLVACKSKKTTTSSTVAVNPSPKPDPVGIGATIYPGYTKADFDSGKSLYENNCGNCHELKKPAALNESMWKGAVANMAPKVNLNAGREIIGEKEKDLILKYLVSAGTAAMAK